MLLLGVFFSFSAPAEEIATVIRSDRLFGPSLVTNIFKPDGPGPFPVVIINHGWGVERIPSAQLAFRPTMIAAEFMRRNFAVVVPMRRGFSGSSGAAVGFENCRLSGFKHASIDDLKAVVSWVKTRPWADAGSLLMLGHSAGGLATLAYASTPDPGVRLFINFSGGLRGGGGCNWESELNTVVVDYGRGTKQRTVWFYGSNDSFFSASLYRKIFKEYSTVSTNSVLYDLGDFKHDSHLLFSDFDGYPLWRDAFWKEISDAGLAVNEVNLSFGRPPDMQRPPASGFAAIDDAQQIPYISQSARNAYAQFLSLMLPRAYAISAEGHWAWSTQGADAPFRALAACEAQAGPNRCKLYAVDNDVVWSRQ